jgi:hypothetical protein
MSPHSGSSNDICKPNLGSSCPNSPNDLKEEDEQIPWSKLRHSSKLIGKRATNLYETKGKESKAARLAIKLFKKWGYFVINYDWIFIILCLLISTICFVKILYTP